MLSLPPQSNRESLLKRLSTLYLISGYYPSDELEPCEIIRMGEWPAASGGFGECWKGLFLGSPVAMKHLHRDHNESPEDQLRRVHREIAVWKGLRHPHILPFIGSITLGTTLYMVSPWMGNGEAIGYLKNHPEANSKKLLLQIAMGVQYLHTLDPVVVHGDLKGGNILISSDGDAYIADFGLSHHNTSHPHTNSDRWHFAGNIRWQAPELLWATTTDMVVRTTMSDIYAFGRVILEVFTLAVPFAHIPNHHDVGPAVKKHNLPPRPKDPNIVSRGLDNRMWRLVEKCSHRNRTQRLSAQEVVKRLREISPTPDQISISPQNNVSHSLFHTLYRLLGLRPNALVLPSCLSEPGELR